MAKILKIKKVKSQPIFTSRKHVRKGDLVKVIAGDHKGLISKISKVFGDKFIMLADVNVVKSRKNKEGKLEDVKLHSKIHISNVMHYDLENKTASRIGSKINTDNKKVKFYKKTNKDFLAFVKTKKEISTENIEETDEQNADNLTKEAKEIITNNTKDDESNN